MFIKTALLLVILSILRVHSLPSVLKSEQDQDAVQLNKTETEQVLDDVVQKPSKREAHHLFHSTSEIADKIVGQLESAKGSSIATLGNKVTGASLQNSFGSSFINQQDKTTHSSSNSFSSTLQKNIGASSGQVTLQTAHDDALNTPYKVADVLYNQKHHAQAQNGFQGNLNHKSDLQELVNSINNQNVVHQEHDQKNTLFESLNTEKKVDSQNKVQQNHVTLDNQSTLSELLNAGNKVNSVNAVQQSTSAELVNTENQMKTQNQVQQNHVSVDNLRTILYKLLNTENKVNKLNQTQQKQVQQNHVTLDNRSTLSELLNAGNKVNSLNAVQQSTSAELVNTENQMKTQNQVQQNHVSVDNLRATLYELLNTENKVDKMNQAQQKQATLESQRSTLAELVNNLNQAQQKQVTLDSQRSSLADLVNTENRTKSQNQVQHNHVSVENLRSALYALLNGQNEVNQVQQKQTHLDNERSTLSELLNAENKVHSLNQEQNHVSLDSQKSSHHGSVNAENKVKTLNQAEQKQETLKDILYALLNAEVKQNQDQQNHVSVNDEYKSLITESKINTLNSADSEAVHQSSLISDIPSRIQITTQKDKQKEFDLDSQIQLSLQDSPASLREILIKIIKYLLENDLQSQHSTGSGDIHHPSIISDLPSGIEISQKSEKKKLNLDSQVQLNAQGSSASLREILVKIIKYLLENDLQSQHQQESNTLNSANSGNIHHSSIISDISSGVHVSQKEEQKKWNLDSQIQLSSGSSATLREILIKIIKNLLENDIQLQHQQGSNTLNSANGGNVHHSTIISDLFSGIQVSQTEEHKKWNLDSQIQLSSGSSASLREILIKIIKYLLENDFQSQHQPPVNGNGTPGHNSNSEHHAIGKYDYAYEVNDDIRGSYKKAWEKREAGKVVGGYIYDDGHIIRDVLYEADKSGFRIIKDNISPSIKANSALTGKATVASYRDGQGFQYVTKQ